MVGAPMRPLCSTMHSRESRRTPYYNIHVTYDLTLAALISFQTCWLLGPICP